MKIQRFICAVCAAPLLFVSCTQEAARKVSTPSDPTTEAWYRSATDELTYLSRSATEAYANGNNDAASQFIVQGETVATRLLAVPRPTLVAAVAASDLDDLYGRMLFRNKHYGWARLQHQKNVARWKHWTPQTPDTEQRLKAALAAIGECDKKLEAPI